MSEPDTGIIVDSSVFQIAGSYIAAPFSSGLLIIDQQAASERVLFDEFCKKNTQNQSSTKSPAKTLLFPQSIELSASQTETLKEIQPTLELLGWDFSWLGGNTFMINAMPEQGNEKDVQKIIEDIIDLYIQKQMNGGDEMSSAQKIAAAAAKRTSIKHGEKLHKEEMYSLISRLLASSNPHTSPSGQKTLRLLSPEDISELL